MVFSDLPSQVSSREHVVHVHVAMNAFEWRSTARQGRSVPMCRWSQPALATTSSTGASRHHRLCQRRLDQTTIV